MAILRIGLSSENAGEQCQGLRAENVTRGCHQTFSANGATALQAEEFRWYFEDYAPQNPFERHRATQVTKALTAHASALLDAVPWLSVLDESELLEPLVIEIEDIGAITNGAFLWELLEQTAIWQGTPKPPAIAVVRTWNSPSPPESSRGKWYDANIKAELNILVVTARPNAANDIPHRLVCRSILDVLHKVADTGARSARMEIVRPGTFAALRNHLASRGPGHFGLVHFDLHGVSDPGERTCLAFLSEACNFPQEKFNIDRVDAAAIGKLLCEYGVSEAVLNACRSARGTGTSADLAAGLMHAGMTTVVAMSHNISERSVEIFTSSFYEALLCGQSSLEVATCIARRAMLEDPGRISKFGQKIDIFDSVVPIVYCKASDRRFGLENLTQTSSTAATLSRTTSESFFGRENDILHMESTLLLGKRPVMLSGPAGIGKSHLAKHLAGWWKETSLIEESFHIQLPALEPLDTPTIFSAIHSHLVSKVTSDDSTNVTNYLQNHRCLVVLDSLESASATKRAKALVRLLKELRGTRSLLIIASRREEAYLDQYTYPIRLGGLDLRSGIQFMRSKAPQANSPLWGENEERNSEIVNSVLRQLGQLNFGDIPPCTWNSEEDLKYMEQLHKLMKGNPLVMEIVTGCFGSPLASPKNIFFAMLGGYPIFTPDIEKRAAAHEGYRSIVELGKLIEELNPQLFRAGGLHLDVLSMFWGTLPAQELPAFLWLYGSQSTKELPVYAFFYGSNSLRSNPDPTLLAKDTLRKVQHIIASPGVRLPAGHPVEQVTAMMLDPLAEKSFIRKEDGATIPTELRSRAYFSIHPLLPIVLRAQPAYWYNINGLRDVIWRAYTLFYAYRTKDWPVDIWYSDAAWDAPRFELQIEFENFAAAAQAGLEMGLEEKTELYAIGQVLQFLHRGTLKDPSRNIVVVSLWERRVIHSLKVIEKLVARRAEGDVAENDEMIAGLRLSAAGLAHQLINFQHMDLGSDKASFFFMVMTDLVNDIKRDGAGEGAAESRKFMGLLKMYDDWQKEMGSGRNDALASGGLATGKERLMAWRQELFQMFHGVDTEDERVPDFNPAVNGGAAYKLQSQMYEDKAYAAMRAGNMADAERAVDDGLLAEANRAGNSAGNKIGLLVLRATLSMLQSKPDEAREAYEEIYRLEDASGMRVDLEARKAQKEENERLWSKFTTR